ncbi:MAG: NAD-dependent epimerase/dehydratase family protein, partial [Anaerolineales bacterium]
VSIGEVIERLAGLIGRSARIESLPTQAGEVPATQADIGKARGLLGWSPQVSLEDGLRECVEWYRREQSWASQIATPD